MSLLGPDRRTEEQQILADHGKRTHEQRRQVALGRWYCTASHPCLLLEVWQAPGRRLGVLPSYTLPPAANAALSSAEGRTANTVDGDRKWKPWAVFIDELPRSSNLTLTCKHPLEQPLLDVADLLDAIDGATAGRPFIGRVVTAAKPHSR